MIDQHPREDGMSDRDVSAARPCAVALHLRFETLDGAWRTFPHHYLLYAAQGTFQLEVADAHWVLPPQRAAWIAADVPIRVGIRAPVTCASILFTPDRLPPFDYACRVFAVSALAREMIHYAMRWGDAHAPVDSTADHFFLALAAVCTELAQRPDHFWLPSARSPELQGALRYTRDHLGERLTCADVARVVGVSERTLARRCATETRMPWRQFLRRARMIRAMELLAESDDAVLDVMYATGFESASAFIDAFRSFTNETPAAYRRRVRGA